MQNKRFIAGATCPKCQAMDKIFTYDDHGGKWRACVSCGFKEAFVEQPVAEELTTRVNQNKPGEKPLAHEVPVESVKLIDPE